MSKLLARREATQTYIMAIEQYEATYVFPFFIKKQSPSSSVVEQNTVKLSCCEVPEMFYRLGNLT